MNALSVKQPWAELVASGRKPLEIRSWAVSYRGPLLIVASSQPDHGAIAHFGMPGLPCGIALCVVELVSVVRVGDFASYADVKRGALWAPADHLYAWRLENPRRVLPKAVKGRLRLYDVPDSLILERCRSIILDSGDPMDPNYARDRLKGAAGD